MDRRVKERLVGATILVVVMVLLVPELLSGPKPSAVPVSNPAEPVRNVTVDLSTQSVAAVTPAQEPAVSAAESAASTASMPPSAMAPSTPKTDAPPAVLETPSPPPTSTATTATHRSWAVQVGSFASRGNADKSVRQLKAWGYSVYVLTSGSGASLRHKVRIGPMADRGAAERAVAKLKALKVTASIVAPAP
jgi:DedD protein